MEAINHNLIIIILCTLVNQNTTTLGLAIWITGVKCARPSIVLFAHMIYGPRFARLMGTPPPIIRPSHVQSVYSTKREQPTTNPARSIHLFRRAYILMCEKRKRWRDFSQFVTGRHSEREYELDDNFLRGTYVNVFNQRCAGLAVRWRSHLYWEIMRDWWILWGAKQKRERAFKLLREFQWQLNEWFCIYTVSHSVRIYVCLIVTL